MANLQKIKYISEKKGMSIRELAERVGIKENQIHVMCRTNSTKIDTLERIANVLEVSISEFFDDTSNNSRTFIKGSNNQFNECGAYNNINSCGMDDSAILNERIKALESIIIEKDERIKELKERIDELKAR